MRWPHTTYSLSAAHRQPAPDSAPGQSGVAALFLFFCAVLAGFALGCSKQADTVEKITLRQMHVWGGFQTSEKARIGYPADLIVTANHEIAIADAQFNQILFFAKSGHIIRRLGRAGKGPLEFDLPDLIAEAGDRLAVWDHRNNRVQYFSPDGAFIATATPVPRIQFNAKAFDRQGNLYYATGGFRADSLIYVYDPQGELHQTIGRLEAGRFEIYDVAGMKSALQQRRLPPAFQNAVLLCTTRDDGLVVAHLSLPLLKKYDLSGQLRFSVRIDDVALRILEEKFYAANDSLPASALQPLRYWRDIAPDGHGGVYLLLNAGPEMQVYHFNAVGKLVQKLIGPAVAVDKICADGAELWAAGRNEPLIYGFVPAETQPPPAD